MENNKKIEELINKVDMSALMLRPLHDWRRILSQECQVYVFGENYLAKRFDQINYKFCEKNEAKEVLVDNLYALLRYKYFPVSSEEVDNRIERIVSSFTTNLKTTLLKVSFDNDAETTVIKLLPDYCVAFRNGVYDFKNDKWLFKYNIVRLANISNSMYIYSNEWAIMWYLDFNFESLGIKITETPIDEFIDIMKELTKIQRNYCFELMYNIAHNNEHKFDLRRFTHLCEVLGYTLLQSFSQYFVMLIGSGQNGKNSLFDGCFTNKVIPRPASNDLDAIENDRFITGSLENRAHNIFLETSAKTYTESKMLKALTGSMYQTIEQKGVNKYSGVINCKYIFAGNDQDRIKFGDNTIGFRRRINMLEIWYKWDADKRFMRKGDYYDTTFSDSLKELKNDLSNVSAYVYFGMYGIMMATKNFTESFKFTINDWNQSYADLDIDLKTKVDGVTIGMVVSYLEALIKRKEEAKQMLYDINHYRLYSSPLTEMYGVHDFDSMIKFLETPEYMTAFFDENDIYMNVKLLQGIIKNVDSPMKFSQELKRLYGIPSYEIFNGNKSYVKVTFISGKLKIKT